MKKIFTLIVCGLVTLAVQAQLPVSTQPSLKNAVLEEFTGIKCVYCPDGHRIAQQIMAAHPNRAFAINIHTGSFAVPSAGQPDFRIPEGDAIRLIPGMNVTGYPQGAVNRKLYSSNQNFAMSRSAWTGAVNTILTQSAYLNVAGQATLDASTNLLTVNIEVYYTASSPTWTNKLSVMLLQNNIDGPQTGGATYNPTMMNPNGTYRHMHALRDVITSGATGEDIFPTSAGSLVPRSYNYIVPAVIGNIPVVLSDLEIIAYVGEDETNIINVGKVPITITTGISETAAIQNLNIFPNPAHYETAISFNLAEPGQVSLNIINAIGQTVRTEKLGKRNTGNQSHILDVSKLNAGLYFVELVVGEKVLTKLLSVSR